MTSLDDGPLRVFVVEDAVAFRERLADYLEEPGRIEMVGFADTEDEAVQYLQAEHPDVVIVDLHLKSGNGIGVMRKERCGGNRDRSERQVLELHGHPSRQSC